ncbi:MAG: hypothetical protein AUJ92_11565 [Armatimonadetes bacterium CG2_30_59_28]|nr:MAG: hypothetical protein AUJ92_11565 [Armatimonadetes bacterium CG2_30_59_28]
MPCGVEGVNVSLDLIDALKQLEREKDISMSVLIEAMEAALVSAYKKNFGSAGNIRVVVDPERGGFRVFAEKCVAEDVANSHTEISLAVARSVRASVMPGDLVEVEVTPGDFGRIAAQTAKQVLMQRLREAERESIFTEFTGRDGELVTGEVQRMERRNAFVNLGRTEALLPSAEQVNNESYRFGDRVKVLILEVRRTTKTPQVVVSRSHPDLIRRLFELEVPEIQEGTVEIKGIAREAGARTKIAVSTSDGNVDPVGACVGHRGTRVQAVVNELSDEKIDIVRWSADMKEYLQNALSPAKVSQVILNEETHSAAVIVPEDQQSLAIGRFGQNVRLAARLTGWRIDIRTFDQYQTDLGLGNPVEGEATEGIEEGAQPAAEVVLEATSSDGETAVEESEQESPTVESESANEEVVATDPAHEEAASGPDGDATPDVTAEGVEEATDSSEQESSAIDLAASDQPVDDADRVLAGTAVDDELESPADD